MTKQEFESRCIKSLASPDTAIDEIWEFVESKIKEAKIEENAKWDFYIKSGFMIKPNSFTDRISELKGD